MKRVLLASLLAACAFAASAQTSVSARAEVSAQARTDAAATPQAQADAQAKADSERNCLRHTGTHIRDRSTTDKTGRKGCVAANGRVYSRDDINRTGQTDIGEALRQLDPSIR